MRLQADYTCDVLVIGSGLAGISCAVAAAETGRSVLICSAGKLFSGSSFYPGTWGLGLIGPDGVRDEDDLIDSICTLGRGMADETLVRSFVTGINPAIERLKSMGVRLKAAQNKDQKDFIPCFDRKHRNWNGILFDSAREVFSGKITQLGIRVLEQCELQQLTKDGERVDGAVMAGQDGIFWIHAGSVAVCTGGIGGLYRYRLTTDDVVSTGQAAALEAGAALTNLEFMQIMPGFVTPCPKTIFNEKTFRYLQLWDSEGKRIPMDDALMEQRSTHGPFTSRLADRAVDFEILQRQGSEGVLCRYDPSMKEDTPEFVVTYFEWLQSTHGLTMDDPFRIALYAHAANGGIRIDPDGWTGVVGLYAAGEATGGMHGADRIGGLSTANGLVFGTRAGVAAAEAAQLSARQEIAYESVWIPDPLQTQNCLQQMMTDHALVDRNEKGLQLALDTLQNRQNFRPCPDGASFREQALCRRVSSQITLARAVLSAQKLRKESRGSHFRADYPWENAAMAVPITVCLEQGTIRAAFEQKKG